MGGWDSITYHVELLADILDDGGDLGVVVLGDGGEEVVGDLFGWVGGWVGGWVV